MAEFIGILKKKDANIQNEISQSFVQCNKKSFSTRSQNDQNASLQSKASLQTIGIMGETISDMDIELEQKHNKTQILEDEIGMPDSKFKEEMNRLDLNETSSKEKMIGL